MSKCKYSNEVCANMTVLNGVAYCDSVPCSLKGELPKQTNADKIRNMTNKEMSTDLVYIFEELFEDGVPSPEWMENWLQSEAE